MILYLICLTEWTLLEIIPHQCVEFPISDLTGICFLTVNDVILVKHTMEDNLVFLQGGVGGLLRA